ncbi:MAG: BrnT family toxin [Candidatus Poribacteria bacterium]|nr:BrnT family toxin [Candidatus Poribacteria bacterium]
MKINEVIWQSQFVDKLASKHGVSTTEVEEVLINRPLFRFISKGNRTGEDVYSAMGQTDEGRYLIVIFILKPRNRALVISARDMDSKERRYYGRKK